MAIRLIPKRLVGQTIRGVRGRLGQTPAQFAESVGVEDASVVEAWEDGSAQPDAGTLARIAAMGLVDVLVFHDDTPAHERPQLTPGEASELGRILSRMEALLAEARQIADAAADRTAVQLLEAASGHAPAPAALEAEAVTLAAEVTVKPRARRAAADSSSGGGSKTKSSGGGKRGSSSRGDARTASRSRSSKAKSSSGSGSGGASSSTSDTGSGASKPGGSKTRSRSKSGGSASAGGSSSGGGSGSGSGGGSE